MGRKKKEQEPSATEQFLEEMRQRLRRFPLPFVGFVCIFSSIAIGFIGTLFFGLEPMLNFIFGVFALLVAIIASLFPIVLWILSDPENPVQYLKLRWIGRYLFAGLMLVAIGPRTGIPWMNGIAEEVVCAPGYETLNVANSEKMGILELLTDHTLRPYCSGELGKFPPRHFSNIIAHVSVYTLLILLLFGINLTFTLTPLYARFRDMRFVATPLAFIAVIVLIQTVPAPFRTIIRPVRNFLADGGSRDTLLHDAIKRNDLDALRTRLEAGDRVDGFRGLSGSHPTPNPPLYLALRTGRTEHARVLLEYGADTDIRTSRKLVATHFAAQGGNVAMLEAVLEEGAPLDPVDNGGRTPLYYALKTQNWDAARMLLDHGADPAAASETIAAQMVTLAVGAPGDLLQRLHERGAGMEKGGEALVSAARDGQWGSMVQLLELGADPDAKDRDGLTALHHLAGLALKKPEERSEQRDAMNALLDHGANPNATDREGITPLIVMIKQIRRSLSGTGYSRHPDQFQTDLELVRLLVKRGADPNQKGTRPDYSAFDWAKSTYPRERQRALIRALQ